MEWPDFIPSPGGAVLLHCLDRDGKETFEALPGDWPCLDIHSHLPLHVIQVCSVALHRGELDFTEDEIDDDPYLGTIPGYEFSGYVVATSPRSPLKPGTEV